MATGKTYKNESPFLQSVKYIGRIKIGLVPLVQKFSFISPTNAANKLFLS
jgi:hypothetical protein